MRQLSFLLKDSIIYGGANAISKLTTLITFPLLARYFGVEQFGIYDYLVVLSSFITIIFVFGQDSAVARYLFETDIIQEKSEIISQSLLFQTAGILLITPLIYLNIDYISYLIFGRNGGDEILLKILLFQMPVLLIINFTQNILKWTFRRNYFLIVTLGYTVINAIALTATINIINVQLVDVFILNLIINIIFGALGIYFMRGWLIIPNRFNHVKKLVPYAIPFGVICIVGGMMPTLERSVILNVLGASELSQYAVGYKIAMLLSMLIISFQTAWGPFSLNNYKCENVSELFNFVLKLFVVTICCMTLILEAFKHDAIALFAGNEFKNASLIIFPLAMGIAIHAISTITEIGISISKKTHLNIYAYLIDVIITLFGIYFLAKEYGIYGISISFLIGKMAKAILSTYFSIKLFKLKWDIKNTLKLIAITLICGFVSGQIEENHGKINANIFVIVTLITISFFFWKCILLKAERAILIDYRDKLRVRFK